MECTLQPKDLGGKSIGGIEEVRNKEKGHVGKSRYAKLNSNTFLCPCFILNTFEFTIYFSLSKIMVNINCETYVNH